MSPSELARLAWAYAALSERPSELLDAIATHALPRLDSFTPLDLSMLAHALAKCGHHSPRLFQALEGTARRQLSTFGPQLLCNFVWSFARLDLACPTLLTAVEKQVCCCPAAPPLSPLPRPRTCSLCLTLLYPPLAWDLQSEEALPGALWKHLPTFWHGSVAFIPATAGRLTLPWQVTERGAKGIEPAGASMLLWSYATLGHPAPHLFHVICQSAEADLGRFEARNLATIAWSCAMLGHAGAANFVHELANEAAGRLVEFAPADLAQMLWACGWMGVEAPLLFTRAAEASLRLLPEFSPQELCMLVRPLLQGTPLGFRGGLNPWWSTPPRPSRPATVRFSG